MKTGKSKHTLISAFAVILSIILLSRLFVLTVVQNGKWDKYVESVSQRIIYQTAPRGDILDCEGRVLATSRPVYSVSLSRVGLTSDRAVEILSEVTGILNEQGENIRITQQELREKLEDEGYYSYMPLLLADDVSEETADRILSCRYGGVQISADYIRTYPNGSLASHVIGYLGRISEDEEELIEKKGYRSDAFIGKSGIEKEYENSLKGRDGETRFQVDSNGKVRSELGKSSAEKGDDVQLTIDIDLQETAESALKQALEKAAAGGIFESIYGDYQMTYAENAASGAAVAIDVKTGEVIAMASCPDFDPNDFTGNITEEKWQSLQRQNVRDPLSPYPLYNVAALTAVQPGSVFKPVTALAALECGLDRNRFLYDAGYIDVGYQRYGCYLWNDEHRIHGYVDLNKAMRVSCNYYFYDIASGYDFASGQNLGYNRKIKPEKIMSLASSLGLGSKTGIEIDESAGVIPSEILKIQGIKNSLRSYLLVESENYFKKEYLKDRQAVRKKIEKIVNWADKGLTLDEIIGKLSNDTFIRADKVENLAALCKYDYFDQIRWNTGDTFNISIGQGDNSYTTLQIAGYMATLGNNGMKNRITLVKDSSEKIPEDSGVSQKDIEHVIESMKGAVQESDGSLYRAFNGFGYSVAGKTGTAQRQGYISTEDEKDYIRRHLHLIASDITFENVQKEADRLLAEYPDIYDSEEGALRRAVINLSSKDIGYDDIDAYKKKYDNFAWTAALAPAEDPQIAVAVMLVQGKSSSNAAPVVREIIGKYGDKSGWEKLF